MQDFKKLIKAGLPTLLVGPAGTAKTSVLRQFASDNKREVVDLRVAMMPPEDLVGIPQVNKAKGCFDYLPPAWAKEHEHNQGADLMIIVEEIHLAPPATHAALYQLLQEKEVAGVNLSKAWVAATANPPNKLERLYVGSCLKPYKTAWKWLNSTKPVLRVKPSSGYKL